VQAQGAVVFFYQGRTNLLVARVLWASAEMAKMKVHDIGGISEKLRNEAQIRSVKMKALKISGNSQVCVAPDEKEILVQGGRLGGQRFSELIVAVGVSDADSQTAGMDSPSVAANAPIRVSARQFIQNRIEFISPVRKEH
jgi:hypothetical protein